MRKQIDDGTIELTLENKFGAVICAVHIRPADISIMDRYNDMMQNMDSLVEPLKALKINADGTAAFEDQWAAIKAVETGLTERIGAVFDMDDVAKIFAKRNPFSSVNGKFFCEIVLEALGDIIEQAIKEEAKKSEKRMNKYLADLPTDRHLAK